MKTIISLTMIMGWVLLACPAAAEVAPADLNPLYIYVGTVEDGGWSKSLERGRLLTDQKYPGVNSRVLQNLPEAPEFMILVDKAIKACNSRLVIAASYGYGEFLTALAARHPQVAFVHITGYSTAPNLASAFSRIYQMRYLAGIVAGFTTQSNKIGYVAGYPIAEVIRGINAFTLGVRKVNPQAEVQVVWLDSWFDIAKEEHYACRLIENGCDVLAMHTDTTAIAQVCERKQVAFVGYSSNMREFAPSQFLVAPLWNWEVIFSRYYQQVIDGNFTPEYFYPDLSSSAIGLSEYGPRVSGPARQMVAAEKAKLLQQDDIFNGPIKDNQGQLRLLEGQRVTLQQLQTMNWFVQGVTEVNFTKNQ